MTIRQYDITGLDWLNSHLIYGSVPLLQFVSAATTYVSIGAVFFVLMLAWRKKSSSMLHNFIMMAIALVLSALMIQLMKALFDRERPFITYQFIEKLSSGGGSCFPSGHTMEAFAMATIVSSLFQKRWLMITVFIWAIIVGYSRIALGVHYPLDVIAGALTGAFIGLTVPLIYRRILRGKSLMDRMNFF